MATTTLDTAPLHPLAVDGTTVAYTDRGSGDPILMIHAGVFGAWFAPLAADPLLASARVVRMLRAGYTGGPPPACDLSIADHARHCAILLETLDAAPAHVVAHSSGSVIALQLALDRPDLVRSLVLGEPPLIDGLVDPADREWLHTTLGPTVGAAVGAAMSGDVETAFRTFMDAACGREHPGVLTAALGPDALDRALVDARYFFTGEAPATRGWTLDDAARARIGVPVLLVQGGASPGPTHRLVARLAATLPRAEVATVDGDDHLLPLRSPHALAELVSTFTGVRAG
jgi:pimeloyl-ACP methyl ester carboxylesterase